MLAGGGAVLNALRATHSDRLTIGEVIALARGGDPGCQRAIADAGRAIGTGLAASCNLVNPVNPQRVVGGELGAAGELLLGPLRESLNRGALRSAAQDLDVVEGALGDRAEVLGAVALALRTATPVMSRVEVRFGGRGYRRTGAASDLERELGQATGTAATAVAGPAAA
jgi:predicted NBD/HSP70 family sugar kinase